jgi:hypothetical protein
MVDRVRPPGEGSFFYHGADTDWFNAAFRRAQRDSPRPVRSRPTRSLRSAQGTGRNHTRPPIAVRATFVRRDLITLKGPVSPRQPVTAAQKPEAVEASPDIAVAETVDPVIISAVESVTGDIARIHAALDHVTFRDETLSYNRPDFLFAPDAAPWRDSLHIEEQITFERARLATVPPLANIRDTISRLTSEQTVALLKALPPEALAYLSQIDGCGQRYHVASEDARLATRMWIPLPAWLTPSRPPRVEPPESIIQGLARKVVNDPESIARILGAYQTASQSPLIPAFSVTGFMPIGHEHPGFAFVQSRVTPNWHDLIGTTGDLVQESDKQVQLVTILAPQILGPNVSYPLTRSTENPWQHIIQYGDARGVVVANAIYSISKKGNFNQLLAAFAPLGIGRPSDRRAHVPDSRLHNVVSAATQTFRMEYAPDDFQFLFGETGFATAEGIRKQLTMAGKYFTEFTGVVAYESVENPNYQSRLGHALLGTRHHLIGARTDPFVHLMQVVVRPEFSPRDDDGLLEEQGVVRGRVFAAAAAALYDIPRTLSTPDDPVFPHNVANFFIRPAALSLIPLLEDRPSRVMRALMNLDIPGKGGAALTKLMVLLHNRETVEQIPIFDRERPYLSQLPLIGPNGPLWRVFEQLCFGDGRFAPSNDQDWQMEAARYALHGESLFRNDGVSYYSLGLETRAYFLGSYAGTMPVLSREMRQEEDMARFYWRGAAGVVREIMMPALVTTYVPNAVSKIFVPIDVAARTYVAWYLEQVTGDAVRTAYRNDARFSLLEEPIGYFATLDLERLAPRGLRTQPLFNEFTGPRLSRLRVEADRIYTLGGQFGHTFLAY